MISLKMFSRLLAVTVLTLGLFHAASANIWIDESFEDGPFTQGNGNVGAPIPSSELDIYSFNALANTITASPLTNTGTTVNTKAFTGSNSYQLDPGDVLSVGANYQDPANGNYVIFQFAVNVDPIPAAGEVARFRYNHDTDTGVAPSPDHSFYVKLQSTGTAVDIIAGEDVANGVPPETTIGTLTSATEWQDVTVVIVNGDPTAPYCPPSLSPICINLTQGAHFYGTGAANINFASPNGLAKTGLNWGFSVTSGVLYIDDLYWEAAMEGLDDTTDPGSVVRNRINVRPFAPSSVADWQLFD